MAEHATKPHGQPTGARIEDLDHIACDHDADTAFCGTDVSDQDWNESKNDPEHPCVVCEDLDITYAEQGICCPKETSHG